MMEGSALRRFENLIRARSGLSMREQEAALLQKTLVHRAQTLRFAAPAQYLDFLSFDTAESQSEWSHLFVLLTNQESYFFRDQGQLNVIREHILPALIRRQRDTRTLRIWSAGCSTGEEAYSLAMMLDEMLPFRNDWDVLILGTDLSAQALEKARGGVYGAWSFRMMDAEKQKRFFVARGKQWEIKPQLRQSVKFASGNLLLDEFPSRASELHEMDLIVCRNVFIYFARDAVSRVLRKFSATLQSDGYLVTGHSELHGVELGDFGAQTFPQSVIYQRRHATRPLIPTAPAPALRAAPTSFAPKPNVVSNATRANVASKSVPIPRPPSPRPPGVSPVVLNAKAVTVQATAAIRAGRHEAAMRSLPLLLEAEPRHLAALCLAAQACANLGRLDEAEAFCQRAIEVSAFAPLPYHLLARIAAERGDRDTAKTLLKKVTYLNPESVLGYLELSDIYAQEGDTARAAQMQRAAYGVLDALPDDTHLPTDEHAVERALTAGEVRRQLKKDANE